ncbi:MAG: PDZ domain-containing protein [Candidatus Melainabacteria bacterium]|nr:PDZ domain-containing protein [Candidatus Melainabacteria bacterium]
MGIKVANTEVSCTMRTNSWWIFFLLLVVGLTSVFGSASHAEDAPVLKPDVPRLDAPTTGSSPESVNSQAQESNKKPLQGKIQHSAKIGSGKNKLTGGALGDVLKGFTDTGKLKGSSQSERLNAQAQSGIGIIGVKFVMVINRPPVINKVFPLTPAARWGLKINDVIVAVDGVPTFGLAKEEVYDMIIGLPDTPVTLSLVRDGDYFVVTLTRMDLNEITDPWVRRDYLMQM